MIEIIKTYTTYDYGQHVVNKYDKDIQHDLDKHVRDTKLNFTYFKITFIFPFNFLYGLSYSNYILILKSCQCDLTKVFKKNIKNLFLMNYYYYYYYYYYLKL